MDDGNLSTQRRMAACAGGTVSRQGIFIRKFTTDYINPSGFSGINISLRRFRWRRSAKPRMMFADDED
jgi:hypothetical protein